MNNVWKLSNYLFGWYWEKRGKIITIVSLCAGVLVLAASVIPTSSPESYDYYSKAFRSYDMAIDGSFLPIVFALGLMMVFILQFVQMKGFSVNSKGLYSVFMLPMKRKEIYLSFLLSAVAAVTVYYLLWLVLLVVAYFPITAYCESAAAKEIIYMAEGVTLTGLDTHIENGLFLAFRRSAFLATFFPVTLWHILPFLAGLMMVLTGMMYGCFCTKRVGICVIISMVDVLWGICLLLITTSQRSDFFLSFGNEQTLFLGRNVVLAVIAVVVLAVHHINILKHLEEELEL